MKNIIALILTLAFSGTAVSQDKQLEDYILECQKYFSSKEGASLKHKEPLESFCIRDGEANLLWYSSGKSIVYVTKDGCSFMGLSGTSAEECLPEKLPNNLKAIQILIDNDAKTSLVTSVSSRVKTGGAQTVIIRANE